MIFFTYLPVLRLYPAKNGRAGRNLPCPAWASARVRLSGRGQGVTPGEATASRGFTRHARPQSGFTRLTRARPSFSRISHCRSGSQDASKESVTRDLSSTTLTTQLKRLTNQPSKDSPHPRRLLSLPASSYPPASLSAKRPPVTIRLCHHRIRRPISPVCFSCTSTMTQPRRQQTPQN